MEQGRSHWGWAIAATVAVHTLLGVGIDVAGVLSDKSVPTAPPRIELVDIEVPKPPPPPAVKEPEPPPPEPAPTKAPPPPPAKAPPRAATRTPSPPASETPPAPETPTTNAPLDPSAGGSEVLAMPDIAPSATGVPVRRGARTTGRTGQGGVGGGTGTGAGSGSGSGAVSIAAIKKKAMPRGDFDYFDVGRDYPPEARRLAVEGQIRVRLLVDASGKVTQRTLLNKLGHGLDELALKRAAALEFDPAIDTADRPVASVVVWTFTFTLPK
jgi:periplasmic protein TonB